MNVFMLGWEFPPFISGGLGTACFGMTRAMSDLGHHVIFVLPRPVGAPGTTHVKLRSAGPADIGRAARRLQAYEEFTVGNLPNVAFRAIPSTLHPYADPTATDPHTPHARTGRTKQDGGEPGQDEPPVPGIDATPRPAWIDEGPGLAGHYGGDMISETRRYAAIALDIALAEDFDVIHAHDWMTFPAAITVAQATGKPLVVQIHSTEFDRSGEHVNQPIYDIERRGVHVADRVIAVSHLTRNILLARYGADPDRVEVIYNAIDLDDNGFPAPPPIGRHEKIVLFLGRITMQKGPEYFLAAAKKVLEYEKNVRFVMAGSGDLIRRSIELAAEMGIGQKVVFTGFLRGPDVARVFKMADLYVMPSVSEPFGIAPLEALSHDVPVLISKQSGVSEVLTHALKVDFWDIDEMANKIIAVLRHTPLQMTLRDHGSFEVRKFTWKDSAGRCIEVYGRAVASAARRRAG